MFAIIKTGGKQYKVTANDVIMIEKLTGDSGDFIEFPEVLMMGKGESITVGTPLVANALVRGMVLDQIRDDKVIIFKKKKRHNYRRKNGHRQYLTVVRITDIFPDKSASKAKPSPTAKPEKSEGTPVKKTESVTEKKSTPEKKTVTEAKKFGKGPVKKTKAVAEEKKSTPPKKKTAEAKKPEKAPVKKAEAGQEKPKKPALPKKTPTQPKKPTKS